MALCEKAMAIFLKYWGDIQFFCEILFCNLK